MPARDPFRSSVLASAAGRRLAFVACVAAVLWAAVAWAVALA